MTRTRAREAKKVFWEVKEPFSEEKGSLPPEALERSVKTPKRTLSQIKFNAATWNKVINHCQIFLRTQKNSQIPSHKPILSGGFLRAHGLRVKEPAHFRRFDAGENAPERA